ncbi:MAG: hypothetical protein ACJASY_001113 [Halioglobus sp.]|jgi:hypothetical protein
MNMDRRTVLKSAGALVGALPLTAAVSGAADNYLRVGYGIEDQVRVWAGEYFGVSPRQVSLASCTTMGLATLYNNISIKPGQEVLTTEHEHYPSQQ